MGVGVRGEDARQPLTVALAAVPSARLHGLEHLDELGDVEELGVVAVGGRGSGIAEEVGGAATEVVGPAGVGEQDDAK
ncbi:MAG TPA: hypothetical protein VGX22_02485, partial [Candidatus Dormibacteraeota bacterium]|nr:hypothetical protein [Candidatus Dormibacteraeota bacterium]